MDNFLHNIRKSSPEKISPPSDDWRKQPILPLIRNESRDDFKARESSESNSENYVIEIFPKPDHNHPEGNAIYRKIFKNNTTVPGLVDLRTNNEGKYIIWLGTSHIELTGLAAQIPDDPMISQYLIGIIVHGDKISQNIHVLRDSECIQKSCDRTPEQITKILDAVDIALKNNF